MYKIYDDKVILCTRRNIQKTIKIDKDTFDTINSCVGRSFNDKLCNLVYDYRKMTSLDKK